MDASQRGALMLVRFIAASLIGWSIVNFVLYLAISKGDYMQWQVLPCIFKALPALVGIVMLVKARALAEWIADQLDQ